MIIINEKGNCIIDTINKFKIQGHITEFVSGNVSGTHDGIEAPYQIYYMEKGSKDIVLSSFEDTNDMLDEMDTIYQHLSNENGNGYEVK